MHAIALAVITLAGCVVADSSRPTTPPPAAPTAATEPAPTGLSLDPMPLPDGARFVELRTIDRSAYLGADLQFTIDAGGRPTHTTRHTSIDATAPACVEIPADATWVRIVTSARAVSVDFDTCN
jgi:hypothetical protein